MSCFIIRVKNEMTVRVINPLTDSKEMTENYISALYGCSLIEFARQIEKEKQEQNDSAVSVEAKAVSA